MNNLLLIILVFLLFSACGKGKEEAILIAESFKENPIDFESAKDSYLEIQASIGGSLFSISKEGADLIINFNKKINEPGRPYQTWSKKISFESSIEELEKIKFIAELQNLNEKMNKHDIVNIRIDDIDNTISFGFDFCCPPLTLNEICDTCSLETQGFKQLEKNFDKGNSLGWIYRVNDKWYVHSSRSIN